MSDLKRALFGLRVGDEFEPGQTIFAVCGAVPLPGWPEDLPPDVLDPLINAVDTGAGATLMVTDDYVMHVVDESTTRLMKSFVFNHAPIPQQIADIWSDLIDDEDNIWRLPRSVIAEAGTYRYDYETRGLIGAKVVPLYYHVLRDTAGFYHVFLQQSIGRAQQIAERMGTQLEAMSG